MSAVLNFSLGMKKVECCNCHMAFAMSEEFYRQRRNDHESFFCPAGHRQYYSGKSEEEKLREQLADKERTLERERRRTKFAQDESIARFHQLNATKGVVTKMKKKLARVDNGICPECGRTVSQLARHMQSKHGVECNKPPKGSKVRA